ncbi:MAG TPA: prolipoprotein diacylglyceryl transferase family protein [Dehalococcoidia bacterium]|nr:prolipoprotein diacylglyceryl transferase family protein [Dehalococcoidia bacterium]
MADVLSINIGMDPNIGEFFGLLITWHGFFTAVGIIAGVWLSVNIAASERVGIDPDTAYTLGMIVVACGIVGARALYVIENYGDNPSIDSFGDIFRINEGGISIYGAIIGGAIGGWAYGLWKRLPSAAGADAAAFGMLLGLAIGRIGDIINGEHFAKTSDLPWAVTYSHPNSTAFAREAMHPAVAYEMLGDLAILGVLWLLWKRQPKSGVIFALSFLLYGVMRFAVSFLRIDSEEPALGLSVPQLVSLVVVPIAALLLAFFLIRKEPERGAYVPPSRRQNLSRAERRRRLRAG